MVKVFFAVALLWFSGAYGVLLPRVIVSDGSQVEFNMSRPTNAQILRIPPNSRVQLTAVNSPDVRYILVQAHSHLRNVTLSYEPILLEDRHVNGTNLGFLVELQNGSGRSRPLYLDYRTASDEPVSVLVFAQSIPYTVPIPGGCNVEFSVQLAPYLRTRYTSHSIIVEHQAALQPYPKNSPKPSCERNGLEYELFHSYLPAMDFSETPYFDLILLMSNLSTAREVGREVRLFGFAPKTRSQFANYRGIGHVFTVVAIDKLTMNTASVYVPAVNYGCDPGSDNCRTVDTPFSKSIAAASFLIGLFLAFFGHRYFRLEMFLMGFLAFAIISFVIAARESELEVEWTFILNFFLDVTLITVASATVGGLLWIFVWYLKAEPAVSILVPIFLVGFLSACCVYYVPLNFEYLVNDFNFWTSFFSCMLVLPVFLIIITWQANILACVLLGTYLMIAPIAHALGSSLAYIVFNILRRATVPSYKYVILDPPFQHYDEIMLAIWAGLALLAAAFQFAREWKNPAFPEASPLPHLPWFRLGRAVPRYRRQFPMPLSRNGEPDERTPLYASLPRPIPKDMSFFSSV